MRNTTIPISHHRCGIRALIQIHQTERGLLALSVVQALLEAAFPYIELYDSARIIDLVIEGNFPAASRNIALLAILICIAGLGLDAGNGLHAYLSNRAQRNMLRRISQKAMELDYEEMEDTGLLHHTGSVPGCGAAQTVPVFPALLWQAACGWTCTGCTVPTSPRVR